MLSYTYYINSSSSCWSTYKTSTLIDFLSIFVNIKSSFDILFKTFYVKMG